MEDKRLDKQIGGMAATGIGYVLAMSDQQGDNWFAHKTRVTLAGAAPHAFTFADLGLPNMQDSLSMIIPSGPAALGVDVPSTTALGFSLLGGTAADVVDLLIIGRPMNKP